MTDPGDLDRTLRNVGAGPASLSLGDLAAGHDFLAVFLQRDHYCTNCREQVQSIKDRYEDFRAREAEPVSIVPEPSHRVAAWQDRFDLPYPLLADPEAGAGDAFGQPVRFGWLGSWSDFLGRMPAVVLLDVRDGDPEIAWVHRGTSTFDRPALDEVLAAIDECRNAGASEPTDAGAEGVPSDR